MSSGQCGWSGVADVGKVVEDRAVDLAGDVALQAADDLLLRAAFSQSSLHVRACRFVPAEPADHDDVERRVGVAVTAAIEAMSVLSARGRV